MISNMSVPICNRFHTIIANNGKIMSFKVVPLFEALVRGEPSHPGAHECGRQTDGQMSRRWLDMRCILLSCVKVMTHCFFLQIVSVK